MCENFNAKSNFWSKTERFFLTIADWAIRIYQSTASIRQPRCRFHPTCSEYSRDALRKYGLVKGFYKSISRISKCHPWGDQGYDPA